MKQIVQTVSNGQLKIVEVPQPVPGPTEVLVATRRTLLSAGTEKAVRELASANLLQKARTRPDLVRQVLARARSEGVRSTVAAVRTRLDDEMPLGYSGAGIAVSVGEHVQVIRPGMRVATASAGHAEYQVVPGLLAVPIPDEVTDEDAAFGAVAAIALQGLRQANVGVGGSACVIGLGLVGQLTVRLSIAAGLNVIGIDLRQWTADLATAAGALGLVESGDATTQRVHDWTRGRGVDAVLLTAATSSSEPVRRATSLLHDRGRLVVVGDVGLELDRRPFYENEIDIKFARSYGPGRYDRTYEQWGVDYPIGHVRWTEGRNIEAYLDLLKSGKVVVSELVTHVFEISQAHEAYRAMQSDNSSLAVQLEYAAPPHTLPVKPTPRRGTRNAQAGIIGAGNYARATFLPAMLAAGWGPRLSAVTSSKGLSARHMAERYEIGAVLPTASSLIAAETVDIIFILSRHDSHASLVVEALNAGKHVYVEKPLAISQPELAAIQAAYSHSDGQLHVGFNRRSSKAAKLAKEILDRGTGPLSISYRVSAGTLPATHWYKDRTQGGRILGEVCHYIDFVNLIVGVGPTVVHAHGDSKSELLLTEDVTILLGYADGSSATISYSTSSWTGTPKEIIDIMGRGMTINITDFRRMTHNGKVLSDKTFDKGHTENLRQLAARIDSGSSDNAIESFVTSDIALRVVASLSSVDGEASLSHVKNVIA